ncbi:MAG: hypothetical protein C4518_16330 [Desulfobacteraceae bacterium]|nr:MAG: hypothetical protein C4518_16330 [Desulfobacteraceae bacterium]
MIRPALHILLHFLVPAIVARWAYKDRWKQAWAVMVLTMIVDLDHLWATPIFSPDRCSIGFHPLHTWPAIFFYGLLTAIPASRIAGIGLIIHMVLDAVDCIWMRF